MWTRPPLALGLLLACACATAPGPRTEQLPELELVESWPLETDLDHPDLRDAADVWIEMIGRAASGLSFAHFYASSRPGSRLEDVLAAIRSAGERGVLVRFLADARFRETYPDTLARLDSWENVEVAILDLQGVTGGVQHAKYFVVDGREAWFGSQNFDWRSLEHIVELGLRTTELGFVGALVDVFESDWVRAVGLPGTHTPAERARVPARTGNGTLLPAFSPRGLLPDEALWDLPRILALLDGAELEVSIQLLSFETRGYRGEEFPDVRAALERAAARGVRVRLMVADWGKRERQVGALQSLQRVPGVEVRFVTIPPWSGGHVPFGRVIHAKYVTVDGRAAWLGTSNFGPDYFHASRNVGAIVEGGGLPERLGAFFEDLWSGPYAEPVDPDATYVAPHYGE